MRIGILKKYLLKEANIEEFTVRLIRDKNSVSLEIEGDDSVVFKKNFDDEIVANNFFDSIFQKSYSNFNLRKARINSDDPKAFRADSPSENFGQSYEGGGGFLNHIRQMRDNFRNRKKQKSKPKENFNDNNWESPSEKDDKNYQLTKIGPPGGQISRDDEKNRPGLADADTWKQRSQEGTRPNIPMDEDSIERMRHPERYNDPNFRFPDGNTSLPGDSREQYTEKLTRQKVQKQQDQIRNQVYVVTYEKGGKTQEIPNLSYEKAIEMAEKYPACVIRKMK